jgi:hypothetical protein
MKEMSFHQLSISTALYTAVVPILKPCYWLSDVQVIFQQTERFEVFPSAGMVGKNFGKQGVAAPVSCRFWISGTAVPYMSACASLCKRQPTIILMTNRSISNLSLPLY